MPNLDTLDEYDVGMPIPEEGATSLSAALSNGCVVEDFFNHEKGAERRSYACETCLDRVATRALRVASGDLGTPFSVVVADDRFVVFGGGAGEDGQGLGIWALDLSDGSRHRFATSTYLVTNLSLAEPYIVLAEADGEVHLIDTRDWSDTNVTENPYLQWMAASDGKTIVWVDQRFHAGGTLEKPANQEVVAYDIASKTMRRLTYTDPLKHPGAKWDPDVEGDWVVWTDDRDSNAPNTTQDWPKDRRDIYGYNLKTNKEYHLLGNHAGTLTEEQHDPGWGMLPKNPRLHDGKLYAVGAWTANGEAVPEVWEFALPTP